MQRSGRAATGALGRRTGEMKLEMKDGKYPEGPRSQASGSIYLTSGERKTNRSHTQCSGEARLTLLSLESIIKFKSRNGEFKR